MALCLSSYCTADVVVASSSGWAYATWTYFPSTHLSLSTATIFRSKWLIFVSFTFLSFRRRSSALGLRMQREKHKKGSWMKLEIVGPFQVVGPFQENLVKRLLLRERKSMRPIRFWVGTFFQPLARSLTAFKSISMFIILLAHTHSHTPNQHQQRNLTKPQDQPYIPAAEEQEPVLSQIPFELTTPEIRNER